MEANFTFDLNNIIGIMEYLYEIKNNYFNNYPNECQINEVQWRYTVITCDKNFNEKNFPTLYFENIEANYILNLTYKDLFQIRGDKKYFLIIFDKYNVNPWRFGKSFMQKYFFNFDADNKIIEYYLPQNNSKTDDKSEGGGKSFIWILLVGMIVGGLIVFLIIRKYKFGINKKKRANELDDDNYEYMQKNDEENLNKDKNDNLKIN